MARLGQNRIKLFKKNTNTLYPGQKWLQTNQTIYIPYPLPDVRKRLTIVINPFLCGSGGSAQLKLHPKCHKEPQLSGIFMPLCLLTHTEFFINEKIMVQKKLET